MTAPVRIKRGSSLSLTASFANADGTPYGLAAIVAAGGVLTAQVRDAEMNLVATITPAPSATAGQAGIFVQDTSAWPEGLLRLDVLVQPVVAPQAVSDTFGIYVERAITQLLPEQADYNPVTS